MPEDGFPVAGVGHSRARLETAKNPPLMRCEETQSHGAMELVVPVSSGDRVRRCSKEGPASKQHLSLAEAAMERRVTQLSVHLEGSAPIVNEYFININKVFILGRGSDVPYAGGSTITVMFK